MAAVRSSGPSAVCHSFQDSPPVNRAELGQRTDSLIAQPGFDCKALQIGLARTAGSSLLSSNAGMTLTVEDGCRAFLLVRVSSLLPNMPPVVTG